MYFRIEKMLRQLPEIRAAIHRDVQEIPVLKFLHRDCEGVHLPEFDDRAWFDFHIGERWADLSEGNYGVALLNDCKYGYDIKDYVMRLTLIKSAIRPGLLADRGWHHFTYSLLPHAGGWRAGDVTRQAAALNLPVRYQRGQLKSKFGELPNRFSLVSTDATHIVVDTIKMAEDGNVWILRLFEYQGRRNPDVQLTFGLPLAHAVECNLMEEDERPVNFTENQISFSITPYEIKTLKVWFDAR